jgi:hypothetical protein
MLARFSSFWSGSMLATRDSEMASSIPATSRADDGDPGGVVGTPGHRDQQSPMSSGVVGAAAGALDEQHPTSLQNVRGDEAVGTPIERRHESAVGTHTSGVTVWRGHRPVRGPLSVRWCVQMTGPSRLPGSVGSDGLGDRRFAGAPGFGCGPPDPDTVPACPARNFNALYSP